MSIVTIDFDVSGAAILPNNGGDTSELGYTDEHIKLHLLIDKDEIIDSKSGNNYQIDPKCEEELKTKHLFMALPKESIIDDEIKDKAKEEHSGTEKDLTDLEIEGESAEKEAEGKESDHEDVECGCVNGECLPGKIECNKCHDGWHGTRCDIEKDQPSEHKEDEILEKADETFGGESDIELEDKAPEAHDLGTTEGLDANAKVEHAPE
jgi:hypothetical protein